MKKVESIIQTLRGGELRYLEESSNGIGEPGHQNVLPRLLEAIGEAMVVGDGVTFSIRAEHLAGFVLQGFQDVIETRVEHFHQNGAGGAHISDFGHRDLDEGFRGLPHFPNMLRCKFLPRLRLLEEQVVDNRRVESTREFLSPRSPQEVFNMTNVVLP